MVTASKAMNVKELSDKLLNLYSEKDQEEINKLFYMQKKDTRVKKENQVKNTLHIHYM